MFLGLFGCAYLLMISWPQPILDSFAFRQTQTAITAYWMANGGPLWAYETPVVGAPWSIPFELPLYQWGVAASSKLFALSIDHSGRLIAVAFFLGSALLIHRIALTLKRDRTLALLCAGVFLVSPQALFWGRAVMIESTALFFGLLFVLCMARFALTLGARWLVWASVAAIAAALVKVTTFFGFALVTCGGLLWLLARDRKVALRRNLHVIAASAIPVLLALICLKLYLVQADGLKLQTIWGSSITSSSLGTWNYGTMAQRLDPVFWRDIVFQRALTDAVGSAWVYMIAAIAALAEKRTRAAAAILVFAYFAPFMVFTNLYLVHDYYPYANVAFATSLVGLALWVAMQWRQGTWAVPICAAAVVALCACSAHRIQQHFVPLILQDMADNRAIKLARYLQATTPKDSTLLILGLDWASNMPVLRRT